MSLSLAVQVWLPEPLPACMAPGAHSPAVTWAAQRMAASTSSRPGAFKTDAVVFSKETPTRRSGALSPTIIEQCGFQRSTGTATDLNLPPTLPDVTVEETTTTDLPVASAAVEAASAFSTTVSPSACI